MPKSSNSKVVAVSKKSTHGFSKEPQTAIHLIAGEGVEGDAHRGMTTQHLYLKRRDPKLPNLCQVHLLASELLDELRERGFELMPGELGENILTCGIELLSLPAGTLLHLGNEAIVEVTGLRTPCSQIDAHRNGLQQHLWGERGSDGKRTRRAGIMSIIRASGTVRAGDALRIELPAEPHRRLGPV